MDHDPTDDHNTLLLELLDTQPLVRISSQVPAGRGLVFTQDVRPDQPLLTLPPHYLLNPSTLSGHLDPSLIPSKRASPDELTSVQALSLILAAYRASTRLKLATDHLDFDRFAQTLPDSFDTVPLVWSLCGEPFHRALLEALPTQSAKLLDEVRRRFLTDWERIDALRLRTPSLLLPAMGSVTQDNYLWSWLCINTRCVFLPLGLPTHGDNFTLAPLLDMANHTSDPSRECKVRYTAGRGLELFAPPASVNGSGMKKGEECCITYGAHSNAGLLSEYGFVLPRVLDGGDEAWKGNRFCEVRVDDHVQRMFEEQGQSGRQKVKALEEAGYWLDYSIHPCPGTAHPSHRLVPALRLLALPDAGDTQKWEATLMGYEGTVSDENEAMAHGLLVDLCDRVARDYAPKRQALQRARAAMQALDDATCMISLGFVEQLLDEEEAIVQLVKKAALLKEEW